MSRTPVVPHFQPSASARSEPRVEEWAAHLLEERPELAVPDDYRHLVPEHLEDGPTLHLDDLSEIALLDRVYDVRFMLDRARLRAATGDFVASCFQTPPAYEQYCRERLGLGSPTWLEPEPLANQLQVAYACWEDRRVRRTLVRALRNDELLYVHPHMGTLAIWELAALLEQSSRRPIKVVAPPPAVTKWANDKLAFAETVTGLFGPAFVPPTAQAWSYGALTQRVRELAAASRVIVLKLPDSAGGGGNVVAKAERFRGRSLRAIRDDLKDLLWGIRWDGQGKLLVGSWETDVQSAPSAQLWIPPEPDQPPVVEGLYEQTFEGREGSFVGSRPVRFPSPMAQELVDRCWLLARLFQRLGYVGRCSFDMLLLGEDFEQSRLVFIECNGRWGGTSLPMTLMNRLFGDWMSQPYAARECCVAGLDCLEFPDLLDFFGPDLFDARTGKGSLVFYNPGRMQAQSGINVLALGETWEAAHRVVETEIRERLAELVARRGARR